MEIDENKILERQTKCNELIITYKHAYREAVEENRKSYMNFYSKMINKLKAEFETLNWVINKCNK